MVNMFFHIRLKKLSSIHKDEYGVKYKHEKDKFNFKKSKHTRSL